jgi:hypothetical protein
LNDFTKISVVGFLIENARSVMCNYVRHESHISVVETDLPSGNVPEGRPIISW